MAASFSPFKKVLGEPLLPAVLRPAVLLPAVLEVMLPYLKRLECRGVVLDDGVHGVAHAEAVAPVVVRHPSVVLLDGQSEADERFLLEPREAEEVYEHEDGVANFVQVTHVQRRKIEADEGKRKFTSRLHIKMYHFL